MLRERRVAPPTSVARCPLRPTPDVGALTESVDLWELLRQQTVGGDLDSLREAVAVLQADALALVANGAAVPYEHHPVDSAAIPEVASFPGSEHEARGLLAAFGAGAGATGDDND